MSTDRVHHARQAAALRWVAPPSDSTQPGRNSLEGLHAKLQENIGEAARRTSPGAQVRNTDSAAQIAAVRRQQGMGLLTSYTDLFVHLQPMMQSMRQLKEAPSAPIPGARLDSHDGDRQHQEQRRGNGWLANRRRRDASGELPMRTKRWRVKDALSQALDPEDENEDGPQVSAVKARDPRRDEARPDAVPVEATIVVKAGKVFNGGGRAFKAHPTLNDHRRGMPRKPLFLLEHGARIEDAQVLGPESIQALGDATLCNVWWFDAGKTAFAMKHRGCVRVIGGGASNVADSIFLLEAAGSFLVEGFTGHNFGRFIREVPGRDSPLTVSVKSTVLRNGREAFLSGHALDCLRRRHGKAAPTEAGGSVNDPLSREAGAPREELITDFGYMVDMSRTG